MRHPSWPLQPEVDAVPPKTAPPPQQSDTALVGSVTVILAGSALLSATAAFPALSALLVPVGDRLGREALQIALAIIDSFPMPQMQGVGAAQAEMIRENELRRSAYLVNAMGRLRRELADARAHGENLNVAANTARYAERRFYALHIQAAAQRVMAASTIDALGQQYGTTLGWYSKDDRRTTAECRSANGKNFSALTPPAIGWPGVVHMHCRCRPGAPHPRGRMLE
jgi:hypothetical protein